MKRIYLDYNASTPVAPEVVKEIVYYLENQYGNPSSDHWASANLTAAIDKARKSVADLVHALPSEIVFTSGASEANNHALRGVHDAYRNRGNHIITTIVEHPAVLNTCRFLETQGAEVTYLDVDEFGRVSPEHVRGAITDNTILISVMHANNEVGTVQPIAEISAIARERGILFHADAAQSIGKIPVDVDALGVDLLTVAGHKFYAPKGIGALYIRTGTKLAPFLHGAGHEAGRRAGTENVPYMAGLGKAAELAAGDAGHVGALGDYFWQALKDHYQDAITLNGHPVHRLPNTYHVSFLGYDGPDILGRLPEIAATTGSACHTGMTELSPVLAAMKVSEARGRGAVRFSLGRYTTQAMIDEAIALILARVPLLESGSVS